MSILLRRRLEPVYGLMLLPLGLTLGACSSPQSATSATPAQTPAVNTYAAVARGKVDVEGGLLNVFTPRAGVIAKLLVHEGDHVKLGQALGQLETTLSQLNVESATAELEQAKAQQQQLNTQRDAARQRALRLKQAAEAGAGDGQSADDAAAQVNVLTGRLKTGMATIKLAEQKLAAARYELAVRTLRAPLEADITHVQAQPGSTVSPQAAALFTLLPHTPRIIRAELNEAYADTVKPGMTAQISLEDDRGGHWRAHVLRIGRVIGATTLEDDPQLRATNRTVECVLGLDETTPLRMGQRVLVRFGTAAEAPSASGG